MEPPPPRKTTFKKPSLIRATTYYLQYGKITRLYAKGDNVKYAIKFKNQRKNRMSKARN